MKRPKDIDKYIPAEAAAAQLRRLADTLERGGDLLWWSLRFKAWDDAWLDTSKSAGGVIVQSGEFTNASKATDGH